LRKRSLSVLTCLLGMAAAYPSLAADGDFYIRAEAHRGKFAGFHEILSVPKADYFEVTYCNRTFWVSDTTVLWTEQQAAEGNRLIIEAETRSGGRDIVCFDAQKYVSLDSLGLPESQVEVMRDDTGDPEIPRRNRLRIISEAFKD